ncbi:hypothetical protein [Variovorax sp. PBL-E5]|uniref:hypothetical protein n=1 Tax=Variovorax sp. PBL-E5 TaxID=434014 RepID=UPI0013168CD8|nr:hypothetical protein [Variovorax sp. PBL-E5]VTU37173.1 hypothetical protein E5CHR_04504 [Variovorax sp. PBL-E5]
MMRWVTIEKAAEETGLPASFFHERTGVSGVWPEGKVWKWFDGRKLVDLEALYDFIDKRPSIQSNRGRKRAEPPCQNQPQHQPA